MASMDMASGIPQGDTVRFTFLRQYTTKSPIAEQGSTCPKYLIYEFVDLFPLNNIKGKNLVVIVANAAKKIIIKV